MPKGVPSAGKRVAQFNKPYVCASCHTPGWAATSKRKYCSPCKIRLSTEMTETRRKAAAAKRGTAAGLRVPCRRCSAEIVKINWRHTTCEPCAKARRTSYHRQRYQAAAGVLTPLGEEMHCQGCGLVIVRLGGKQKWCPDCRIDARRANDLKRYYANPLSNSMAKLMRKCLKEGKEGRSWRTLVPYTLEDLVAHLERQFVPGMTWDNHGEWHIDHIRPLCSFSFQTPDDPQFREAWALTNLQPLWARDNLRKGGRYQAAA